MLIHSYQGETHLSTQDYLDLLRYFGLAKMRYQSSGKPNTISDYQPEIAFESSKRYYKGNLNS